MHNQTQFLEKAFSRLIHYMRETKNCAVPVVKFRQPGDLEAELDLALGENGADEDALLAFLDEYLRYSVRTGHNQFFNQLFSGFSAHSFVGEMVSALTNASMYTYEVAPVATLVEKTVLKKMLALVGFDEGGGTFTTGGSNGNFIAMLCARNHALENAKTNGVQSTVLVAYVSEHAHYSFERAADLLGIGSKQVVSVPCDKNGKMNIFDLSQAVKRTRQAGQTPFFVAATAGTTVLGAFDPASEVAALARKHGIWFHIDGAFGGTVLLSPSHRHLLTGCEQADSFTWDAHKMMGANLICSAILLKDAATLSDACSVEGTEYLFHELDDQVNDLGHSSLQCGRRVESLKLWFLWKHYGDIGLAQHIDYLFELANYAESLIETHPRLELMAPRQSVNLCFRYVPHNYCANLDALNINIREKMCKEGLSFVNYSYLDGEVVIRLVIVNFDINRTDLDEFFERLIETSDYCATVEAGEPVSLSSG